MKSLSIRLKYITTLVFISILTLIFTSIFAKFLISKSIIQVVEDSERQKHLIIEGRFKQAEFISNFYPTIYSYYNSEDYWVEIHGQNGFYRKFNEKYFDGEPDLDNFTRLTSKKSGYTLFIYVNVKDRAKPYIDTSAKIINGTIIFFTIVNILIGFYWLKKYLSPITKLSKDIETLELGDRIEIPNTNDEFSKLSIEFNSMLENLESSLIKEKQFISDVSHELKTPLTVLQGYLKLLKKNKSPEFIDEYIKVCSEEQRRMINLTRALLDLYKLEKSQVIKEKVDIKYLLQNIIEVYRNINQDFSISLVIDSDDFILGNSSHVEQLIYILMDNAIKYSKVDKRIDVKLIDDKLYIRDYGIGMDENSLNRIFDRFYRVEKSRSSEVKGYGIGLSILNAICKKYDYEVEVTSKVNEGSMFIIDFEGV